MTRTLFTRFLAVVVPLLVVTSQSFVLHQPLPSLCVTKSSYSPPRVYPMIYRPDVEETKNDSSTQQEQEKPQVDSSFSLTTPNDKIPLSSLSSEDKEETDGEMSLFVARAILLLVAAIWGTNFAVSRVPSVLLESHHHQVYYWMMSQRQYSLF